MSHDLTCWEVLQVEKGSSVKSIKHAYHKLLRQYKPDEHPDAFKVIYAAYEEALSYANKAEIATPIKNLASQDRHDCTEDMLKVHIAMIDALTYDNKDVEKFNDLRNWSFLTQTTSLGLLQDPYLREYLFDALDSFASTRERYILNSAVFAYLDNLCAWKVHWEQYDTYSIVFEYLDLGDGIVPVGLKKREAGILVRFMVFSLDILFIVLFDYLFTYFHTIYFNFHDISRHYILLLLIAFLIPSATTPGMYIMRIRAYLKGTMVRANLFNAYFWVALLLISVTGMKFFFQKNNYFVIEMGSFLIFSINFILFAYKQKFLQDMANTTLYHLPKI